MKATFALVCLGLVFVHGELAKDESEVEFEIRFLENPDQVETKRVRRGVLDHWFKDWRKTLKTAELEAAVEDDLIETTSPTTPTTTPPTTTLSEEEEARRRRRRRKGKGARELELAIYLPDGTEQIMVLEKRKKFDAPISASCLRGGQIVPDPMPNDGSEIVLFGSSEDNAYFLMRCNNTKCISMGSLYNNTEILAIESPEAEPFKGKAQIVTPLSRPRMTDEKVIGTAFDGSILPVPFETRKKRDLYLSPSMKDSMRARRKRQTTSNMVVELIIIADYSEYLYWLTRANGDAVAAKQIMQMYYILLTNMMDLRFEDLASQKGDSVTFMINDVIYCDTETDCSWIENNLVGDVVNVNKALDDVTTWAWQLKSGMKPHDHIMVISKRDLGAVFDGTMSSDPIGVAWTGGMCTSGYSISMIEDPGLGLIDFAATHEIGHSMSSRHDTTSGCSDSDFYIMGAYGGGPAAGLSTFNMSSNPFKFSTCAAESMHNFIVGLGSGSCLLTNHFNTTSYDQYKSFFAPGVFLPIDTQCELYYGGGSRRCYAIEPTICSDGAWCWNPADPNYCYSLYVREGTLCAENQRCHKGVCVDSNVVAPSCPPEVYSSITADRVTNADGGLVDGGASASQFSVTVAPSSGTPYATFNSVTAQDVQSADVVC